MIFLLQLACGPVPTDGDPCVEDGVICTIAGTGWPGLGADGIPAVESMIYWPSAVRQDPDGNFVVVDSNSHRVRRIEPDGTFFTIIGSGVHDFSVVAVPATDSPLDYPVDLQFRDGEALLAILHENRVRRVDGDGIFRAFAGNGTYGYAGDEGPAVAANLAAIAGLAVDDDGVVYIADTENHVIRSVDRAGIIHTFAGRAIDGYAGDGGPAIGALLNGPSGLSIRDRTLVVADTRNHVIRAIDLDSGVIGTLAGLGVAGFTGDGGPAIGAALSYPYAAAYAPSGDLWIADTSNNVLRVVDADGIIRTVAGTGERAFSGDGGPAEDAALAFPADITFDRRGGVLISDMANGAVRRIHRARE